MITGKSDLIVIAAVKVAETHNKDGSLKAIKLDWGDKSKWFPASLVEEDDAADNWIMPEWLAFEKGAI